MTPLEIMAEAYEQERNLWGVRDNHPPKQHEVVRTDPDEDFIFIFDRFDNLVDARSAFERTRAKCSMAEALRALAEYDFKGPNLLTDEAFKARLHSIASSKGDENE